MSVRKWFLTGLIASLVLLVADKTFMTASALSDRGKTNANISKFPVGVAEIENRLRNSAGEIDLPLPDGEIGRFKIHEVSVLPPLLAKQFPELKTYSGHLFKKLGTTVQLDITPLGLHAQILSPDGMFYIDPGQSSRTNAQISWKKYKRSEMQGLRCLSAGEAPPEEEHPLAGLGGTPRAGTQLRTYRLAIAASGEFTQAHGGTVSSSLSAIASIVNRVNGIYQRELGIRFVLVENNDKIIFTNPETDPYSENAPTVTTLNENQQTIDALIGTDNYDVGHLLNTGAFGLANTRVVCVNGWKARGCIGTSTPGSSGYFVQYVAHEIAHQFGANHTFNAMAGECYGNRHAATAYEPGSGSTLMGYSGFCNAEDLQDGLDSYFHSASFDEINSFITSGSAANCATVTATGNNPPNVNSGPTYTIPKETPFTLTASGSDPDGDQVTFCWEQRDLGPEQSAYDSDNGRSPLFRSLAPTISPVRTFPRMKEMLVNTRLVGELLPQTQRVLHFRVTARDNRGGIATAETQLSVANAGPFRVTSHNTAGPRAGAQLITWSVAGTAVAPINVSRVHILLSTNKGASFNTFLSANTPNDGAEWVVLPNVYAPAARIKIVAIGNIFFDINDINFAIFPYLPPADFNRDRRGDLIWQHDGGSSTVWVMNGTNYLWQSYLNGGNKMSAGWKIVGNGRFDGNLQADILWQHTDGRLLVWLMDGTRVAQTKSLRTATDWKVVSAADFNNNGWTDILLQHADGRASIWWMQGASYLGAQFLRNGTSPGSGWRIVGTGDFNRDGYLDVLFRNGDRLMIWLLKKGNYYSSATVSFSGTITGWQLAALTDFNSDKYTDLLWQHPNGALRGWLMTGASARNIVNLRSGSARSTGWQIVGPK